MRDLTTLIILININYYILYISNVLLHNLRGAISAGVCYKAVLLAVGSNTLCTPAKVTHDSHDSIHWQQGTPRDPLSFQVS